MNFKIFEVFVVLTPKRFLSFLSFWHRKNIFFWFSCHLTLKRRSRLSPPPHLFQSSWKEHQRIELKIREPFTKLKTHFEFLVKIKDKKICQIQNCKNYDRWRYSFCRQKSENLAIKIFERIHWLKCQCLLNAYLANSTSKDSVSWSNP